MIHLVYVSSATKLMDDEDLEFLLKQSRDRNKRQNITGMLLYVDGNFFQILEGEAKDVEEIYQAIVNDDRNKGNIILEKEKIADRDFPKWSMGFKRIDKTRDNELEGYTRFLEENVQPEQIARHHSAVVDLLFFFKNTNL